MHLLFGLANAQATDCNTGCIERGYKFSGFKPKIGVDSALYYSKESLIFARLRFNGSHRPTVSPLHRFFDVGFVIGIGTFIKRHDDIRAEILLNGDGFFRRETML